MDTKITGNEGITPDKFAGDNNNVYEELNSNLDATKVNNVDTTVKEENTSDLEVIYNKLLDTNVQELSLDHKTDALNVGDKELKEVEKLVKQTKDIANDIQKFFDKTREVKENYERYIKNHKTNKIK